RSASRARTRRCWRSAGSTTNCSSCSIREPVPGAPAHVSSAFPLLEQHQFLQQTGLTLEDRHKPLAALVAGPAAGTAAITRPDGAFDVLRTDGLAVDRLAVAGVAGRPERERVA